jgi:hypothetical protein
MIKTIKTRIYTGTTDEIKYYTLDTRDIIMLSEVTEVEYYDFNSYEFTIYLKYKDEPLTIKYRCNEKEDIEKVYKELKEQWLNDKKSS